ncbi:MAG: single-stranded-DNA-specific exonuclease RecJ [Chitinophagaceae bacterium]|nr:MAG: single-stranded-DNA-specific exonuclease RecJ [Chitinophagaceae bacterium]
MQRRWTILPFSPDAVSQLSLETGYPNSICKILYQRGLKNAAAVSDFFSPRLENLHSPWLMKDMEKAVNRIMQAIARKERILVFGDYDVDGTTAVAAMYRFLKKLAPHGDQVDFYIPHRYREGYGVSKMGINHAFETNRTLIISLDCGIKSVELVDYAKSIGVDFIICDHHLPDKKIPDAIAVLNPKQVDCNYPYKDLCGCGVGYKLMSALAERFNMSPKDVTEFLDLVATAIAADIVPMTGENRILAYFGLMKINLKPCAGILALKNKAETKGPMSITNVVFIIAPRINAAGRMDDARKAVELFVETDPIKAMELASALHSDNTDRREADKTITAEALEIIESDPVMLSRKSNVVYSEHWHKGVVGIVASRLIEKHFKPTVVLTRSGDLVSGSARSVPGFNLYEAIYACREHLVAYGGHFAAAGLSLLPEKLNDFMSRFDEVVSSSIEEHMLTPEVIIDAEIPFSEINFKFYRQVQAMEPYGPENMRPVFLTRGVTNISSRLVKDEHARIVVKHEGVVFSGIGFNLKESFQNIDLSKPFDIVYTIDENEWNGETTLQLKVVDMRP